MGRAPGSGEPAVQGEAGTSTPPGCLQRDTDLREQKQETAMGLRSSIHTRMNHTGCCACGGGQNWLSFSRFADSRPPGLGRAWQDALLTEGSPALCAICSMWPCVLPSYVACWRAVLPKNADERCLREELGAGRQTLDGGTQIREILERLRNLQGRAREADGQAQRATQGLVDIL